MTGAAPWCSALAELRQDPMLGTAFPAGRILLVEQPGSWGQRGLTQSGFPAGIAEALEERGRASGIRVQAIRRVGRTVLSGELCWAYVDVNAPGDGIAWGVYRDPAELLGLNLDVMEPTDIRPLYLVCAHGKHDPCCALRGRPVAAELERRAPGQVWETSHLGGDRFAANVLVLPSGLVYGRVTEAAVDGLVAASEAGEIVLPLLRGQVGMPPVAQAAVGYAHTHLGTARRGAVRFVTSRQLPDRRVEVTVAAERSELLVRMRGEWHSAERLTCHAPGTGNYLTYVLEDIGPAPAR